MLLIKFTRLAVNRDKPVNVEFGCCRMMRTYNKQYHDARDGILLGFQTLYLGLDNLV